MEVSRVTQKFYLEFENADDRSVAIDAISSHGDDLSAPYDIITSIEIGELSRKVAQLTTEAEAKAESAKVLMNEYDAALGQMGNRLRISEENVDELVCKLNAVRERLEATEVEREALTAELRQTEATLVHRDREIDRFGEEASVLRQVQADLVCGAKALAHIAGGKSSSGAMTVVNNWSNR
jgi:chromosome segregation ATPase